jgi:hypothetical protein
MGGLVASKMPRVGTATSWGLFKRRPSTEHPSTGNLVCGHAPALIGERIHYLISCPCLRSVFMHKILTTLHGNLLQPSKISA